MKLVMIFEVGDGCTFSCTETFPVEYSSIEDAKDHFKKLCEKARDRELADWRQRDTFFFEGHEFEASVFYHRVWETGEGYKYKYISPEFLTVDEWFESFKE